MGKTTTSAAIAAGMAAQGKKVAVLTIDPAKRLADSLGLPELGNEERQVDPALFMEAGADHGEGELWAMMLDAKATFDEVVRRHAPDEETRERILSNRIYQQLSGALAGSQEYMAMEKLFEIWAEDRYDLLVLDTPPSRNALDFLDAPRRLTQFIEGRSLQVFLSPTGFATKIIGGGTSMMLSVLKRITGMDLLNDLQEFFQAFSGMVGGFQERAKRVNELLADEQSTFLVVCGPQGEPISEAVYFHRKLVEADLPFGGVIVNKVHYELDGEVAGSTIRWPRRWRTRSARPTWQAAWPPTSPTTTPSPGATARTSRHLAKEMRTRAVIEVPYLDHDVHDLAGLMEINRYLFADGAAERERIAAEA